MNQGLCWDAGDTLGWGKAQGSSETSALWIPCSWKTSPHHNLLKEQAALHAKPCPIVPWSCCSSGHGISNPLACSSALPGQCASGLPDLPQTPTPQARTISAGLCPSGLHDLCSKAWQAGHPQAGTSPLGHAPQACQAGDPQACMISAPPSPHPSGTACLCFKGPLDCLKTGLCPQACGTPPTCHPPQASSKSS
jgi:hypothetical protein